MTVRIIARCVHGVEWACADEVSARFPQATQLGLARREITFSLPAVHPGLLELSTVDDVFLLVGSAGGVGTTKQAPADAARRLARLPWERAARLVGQLRPVATAPQLDVVASLEGRRSFNRFAMEQALGSTLEPLLGAGYLVRTTAGRAPGDPDLVVRVFVRGDEALAAIRIGAQPAHRRAYKLDTAPGTLHPPVAAVAARLAAPQDGDLVLDPFCGDGTIPIETALLRPGARVTGSDADPERVRNARCNAGRAGVTVAWSVADAAGSGPGPAGPVAAIITNPPWNLSVDAAGALAGSLDRFWDQVPGLLRPGGRLVALTDEALDLPGALRRRGFGLGLVTGVRLAGRVCHLVLASPPGSPGPGLPDGAAAWRARAIEAGVLTPSGF